MARATLRCSSLRRREQDALVGSLLDQGVLEDVLEFRVAGFFADELPSLEIGQALVELPVGFGDGASTR